MSETLAPIVESVDSTPEQSAPQSQPETIAPKRRGRPPGSKNQTAESLAEKPVNENSGNQQAKRGRPKKVESFSAEAKSALAKQVQGIHMMAAQLSGFGELAISEPESVMLADALVNTSNEYGLSLSGKTGALIQLIGTAAIIYLPRIAVINQKIKRQKREQENANTIIENPPQNG